MSTGYFLTFEGGEGVGKSTQISKLAAYLRHKKFDVVATREVGGSPSAEAIRNLWLKQKNGYWDGLTEVLLISAARREHLTKTILPARERGAWVLCDRFSDSTRAYQGIGLKMGLDLIDHFYHLVAGALQPDLTLLLDCPVEVSLKRMAARKGEDDRYQNQNVTFHQQLRDAYLTLADLYKDRIIVIDASVDADHVTQAVLRAVETRFRLAA